MEKIIGYKVCGFAFREPYSIECKTLEKARETAKKKSAAFGTETCFIREGVAMDGDPEEKRKGYTAWEVIEDYK